MHRRPTSRTLALLLAGALVLASCGDDSSGSASPTTATAPTAVDGATDPDGADPGDSPTSVATFPVTVEGENGAVELAAQPTRIVSLSASVTEVLFSIDAGDQVIAVDQYSDHPAGTPITDLSGFRPNIEAIGGYEPDLVVVSSDRDGLVDALTGVGIPVVLLSSPDDLASLYDHIAVLGAATGHPAEAQALVEQMRTDIDALAAEAPDRDAPLPYFYELSEGHHSITSDTFVGELLARAGLVSIGDGVDEAAGGFPQLSAEYVLDADPAVIFLAYTDGTDADPAAVAARPGWSELTAVREDRVVALDADVASRWGPRVVDLLALVIDATGDGPTA